MRVDKIFLKKEQGRRQMPHPPPPVHLHCKYEACIQEVVQVIRESLSSLIMKCLIVNLNARHAVQVEVVGFFFLILLCTEQCNK